MAVTAYKHEKALFFAILISSLLGWCVLAYFLGWATLFAALLVTEVYLCVLLFFICRMKGAGVLVSAAQFPDIYERVRDCSAKLGLQAVPQVFIMNGNGIFNAFTVRFARQHYVVLHTEIVNAADGRPGVLDFYIGHELARIQRKHLLYSPLLVPGLALPLLGAAYMRACEYTCDQYGAACSGSQAAMEGIALLSAGPQRCRMLNKDEYVGQVALASGFSMSLCELLLGKPWLVKRFYAVSDQIPKPELPGHKPLAVMAAMFIPRLDWAALAVLYIFIIADISGEAGKDIKKAVMDEYNEQNLSTAEIIAADVENLNARVARNTLNDAIKFTKAAAENGDTLVYYYDIALPLKEIDVPALIEKETKSDIKFFCRNDSTDKYRERDLKIISRYYDVSGALLTEIVSDNSKCKKN